MLNTSNIILELDNESQELEAKGNFDLLLKQENFKIFDIFFNRS